MKAYICNETGSGKTALTIFFALYYRQKHPLHKIYANLKLNISNFIYTPYGFLPFSIIKKGNCLIILDDFGNLDNTKAFSTYLATICRKTNTQMIITIQYFTQIPKILRDMCDYHIKPSITHLIYNKKLGREIMTNESSLIFASYKPYDDIESIEPLSIKEIPNILQYIKDVYDTTELVEIPNERIIKQEILKYSKNIRDIELNLGIYTKNRTIYKRIHKELILESKF